MLLLCISNNKCFTSVMQYTCKCTGKCKSIIQKYLQNLLENYNPVSYIFRIHFKSVLHNTAARSIRTVKCITNWTWLEIGGAPII